MSTSDTCPFCGALKILLKTPYVTRTLQGGGEPEFTYCCRAQSVNHQFERSGKRYQPDVNKLEKLGDIGL